MIGGDELIPLFTLVIRLETETNIRIERLEKRENEAFEDRIKEGGDMYHNYLDFIEWARAYDTGGLDMRSKAKHDAWQELLQCNQILLNGAEDLNVNFSRVKELLSI